MLKTGLCTIAATLLSVWSLRAAPVAVRFVEGSVHGFLLLRSSNGDTLGYGEQLKVQRDGGIETRLLFRFKDGSIHDERVFFTQRKVFTLQNYHLAQRGPSFSKPINASLDRTTHQYRVRYRKENGPEKLDEGRLDLPPDVSNGMQSILLKNLPEGAKETVHFVAFTPTPKTIRLELSPAGEDRFSFGGMQKKATRYRIKPQLGVLGPLASLFGKHPPDFYYWIANREVPAFLAFEGPLYPDGPTWRVELTTPQLPK